MYLDDSKVSRVVVLMPDKHMGNLIVSLPAIVALKDLFRDKKFFLVVDKAYRDIVETVIPRENLIFYPRAEIKKSSFFKKYASGVHFFSQLMKVSPDIVIDLDGRNASSKMVLLSRASVRVGSATAYRPWVYNNKVTMQQKKHRVYEYNDIAAYVGKVPGLTIPLRPAEKHNRSLRKIFLQEGIDTTKLIACIHPGAGNIHKQWGSREFAEIGDWLSSSGMQVIFIGSGGDAKKIEEISSYNNQPFFDLSSRLTLGELIALFDMSTLFIGNDSGPMHLADRVGIPVVALFGPVDEERWGPLSEHSIVLRGEEPCKECTGIDCEYNFKCIASLSPGRVKHAVDRLRSEGIIRV
jgi:ADP-heptose:LPS heptosyltransferase